MSVVRLYPFLETSLSSLSFFDSVSSPSHDETLHACSNTAVHSSPLYTLPSSSSSSSFLSTPLVPPRRLLALTSPEPFAQCLRGRLTSSPLSKSDSTQEATVLLHVDALTVFFESGEMRLVNLPCRMRAMHALPTGFLFERFCEEQEKENRAGGESPFSLQMPVVFSLLSCLEEVKPVLMREPLFRKNSGNSVDQESKIDEDRGKVMDSAVVDFVVDTTHQIVWVDRQCPFVVTWSESQHMHNLYLLRRTRRRTEEAKHNGAIRSEILLDKLSEWNSLHVANRVFLCTDELFQPLICLCFHATQTLVAFSIVQNHGSISARFAFQIGDVVDAVPIGTDEERHISTTSSSPFDRDMIVLTPLRRLALYTGEHYLSDIDCHLSATMEDVFVDSIDHPVRNRFTVRSSSRSFRAFLYPEYVSSLTRAAFAAVFLVLDGQCRTLLRKDWLRLHRDSLNDDASIVDEGVREWNLFCSLLLDLLIPPVMIKVRDDEAIDTLSPQSSLSPTSLSATPRADGKHSRDPGITSDEEQEISDNSFAALLSSVYHEENVSHPCFRVLHRSAQLTYVQPPRSRDRKRQRRFLTTRPCYYSDPQQFQRFAPEVLQTLQLLYEEITLDARRRDGRRALAFICFDIAARLNRPDWCEFYQREWPELGESPTTQLLDAAILASAAKLPAPISLSDWCRLTFCSASRVLYPLSASVMQWLHSPFEISRRVCEVYEAMSSFCGSNNPYSILEQRKTSRSKSQYQPHSSVPCRAITPLDQLLNENTGAQCLINDEIFSIFLVSHADDANSGDVSSIEPMSFQHQLLNLIATNFSADDLAHLPFGISLPVHEVLHIARHFPDQPDQLDSTVLELIGRPDLAAMVSPRTFHLCHPVDISSHFIELNSGDQPPRNAGDLDPCGMLGLLREDMRFGADLRLKEVCHILDGTRNYSLSLSAEKTKEIESSNGADLVRELQLRSVILLRRHLGLSIGRGAFTLGTSSFTQHTLMPIPKLSLVARSFPSMTLVELEMTTVPSESLEWPNFHNGVAAGLRLKKNRENDAMHRTWIIYNRPSVLSHQHAGFLYALGLQGHLKCLAPSDLYWYLQYHHDATTMATLLGLSATNRATQDTLTSKMLSLHVPAFLPPTLDIGISYSVRAVALVGLGLLYQGSAHRLMAEVMMNELCKRGSGKGAERESYSLASGMALGLVMLGRGDNSIGVSDLKLEDKLLALIHGGQVFTGNKRALDPFKMDTKCGHIDEGDVINIDLTAPGASMAIALMYAQTNASHLADHLRPPTSHNQLEHCRADHLLLRTVSRLIIMWSEIEPSFAFVDFQLPPFLLPHVLPMTDYVTREDDPDDVSARTSFRDYNGNVDSFHSINSDSESEVDSSESNTQVHSERVRENAHNHFEIIDIDFDDDCDAAMSVATNENHRSNITNAYVCSDKEEKPRVKSHGDIGANSKSTAFEVDYESVRFAYCGIIAGACLAMGLKYAGSANTNAAHVLSYYVRCFRSIRKRSSSLDPRALQLLDKSTTDTCLMTCALALAAVMAGSGDLGAFRLLRSLRTRMEARHSHHHQQALHLAIGLLFLGGGQCTLDNSLSSIAAMFISFCPIYSSHYRLSDQRYYLQILRHLYVLAVRRRAVRVIDTDTGESCYCNIQVDYVTTNGQVEQMDLIAPCLLPPRAQRVRITDALRWEFSMPLKVFDEQSDETQVLYVKRRRGRVLRNITCDAWHNLLEKAAGRNATLLDHSYVHTSFSPSQRLQASMYDWTQDKYLMVLSGTFSDMCSSDRDLSERARRWLYECVRDEKMDMFALCLTVEAYVHGQGEHLDSHILRQFRLFLTFYDHMRDTLLLALQPPSATSCSFSCDPLLSIDFRARVDKQLTLLLSTVDVKKELSTNVHNLISSSTYQPCIVLPLSAPFCRLLVWYALPSLYTIAAGFHQLHSFLSNHESLSIVRDNVVLLPLLSTFFPDCSLSGLLLLHELFVSLT